MAGRKKAGVEPGPAEDLAEFLRRLRRRPDGTDLTYRQLADRLGGVRYCSLVTLSRADRGGTFLPRPETVRGYVSACGGGAAEQEQARRLLATAKRRHQREKTAAAYADPKLGKQEARRRHPTVAPHPDYMRSPIDFQLGLRSYRHETGGLSVRGIARNAEEAGYAISKSAVNRMLTGPRSFPTWDQVEAFLFGCRPHRLPDLDTWNSAWRRVFARPTATRVATLATEPWIGAAPAWLARYHHVLPAGTGGKDSVERVDLLAKAERAILEGRISPSAAERALASAIIQAARSSLRGSAPSQP
ncbi:helix-turn-helix domain-containing protein [Kitasatospora cheerisanensis]|uniref:Uncharacterized protein n=1 Tax=Kitasatospora cheerisanensis KCTC 2395 TaxID=1348663 RepID=A0A066YRA1_9ACTN|nr:helix-turn-helix transcriptional regulator [Kitasatospora cheerisanensis]KDN80460.1 hypothetical protein KCH_77920 [Kitasatospora cheerisanensis KCTC 2395]